MLTFIQNNAPDKTIIVMEGELVLGNENQFLERVHDAAMSRELPVELDMENVRFVDSTGIGSLLNLIHYYKEQGRCITISRVNPVLKLVLSNFLNHSVAV